MLYLSVLSPLFISLPFPPLATPEGSSVKSRADNAHMGSESCLVCESVARQELRCEIHVGLDVRVLHSFNLRFCLVHEAIAADDTFEDG